MVYQVLIISTLLLALGLFALPQQRAREEIPAYPASRVILNLATWEEREKALSEELRRSTIADTSIQEILSQLLYREETDPVWSALDESASYRRYEQKLIDLNKEVAKKYDNSKSWHALVHVNYNPGSDFAEWLIRQDRAIELSLTILQDPHDVTASNSAELLAEALRDCETLPGMTTCKTVQNKREQIVVTIRKRILSLPDDKQGFEIEALGACGSERDITFLEDFAQRESEKRIDSSLNQGAYRSQQSIIWLCRRAEEKIRTRIHQR